MPIQVQHRKIIPGTRGFTLVEMMIVVVIIGIMSSISVPPLFRYVASHQLQTNTDRMASDMQYARSVAISNGQTINFVATAAGYTATNNLSGLVIRQVVFDEGVALAADTTVKFFPWGMADDAIFRLSSAAGTYELSLLPTGIVEVASQ